jgi:hypothetical protein
MWRVGRSAKTKGLLAFILTVLAGSALAQEVGFGFVKSTPDGEAYLYTTQAISHGEVVSVQFPNADGAVGCCTLTKTTGETPQPGDVIDLLNNSDIHRYRLDIQYKSPFIGIAVVGQSATENGATSVELKHSQALFTTCLSQEGVHLFARTKGVINGHLYLSLGYETEPGADSCETQTHGSQPSDVSRYIKSRDNCDALREDIPEPDPNDAENLNNVISDINTSCKGTDNALKRLKRKYANNETVLKTLSVYEENIEADMSF